MVPPATSRRVHSVANDSLEKYIRKFYIVKFDFFILSSTFVFVFMTK